MRLAISLLVASVVGLRAWLGVAAAVATLQASRTRVVMVTGDAKDTALAVAASLGFYDPLGKGHLALSGHDTETLSAAQLCACVRQVHCIGKEDGLWL